MNLIWDLSLIRRVDLSTYLYIQIIEHKIAVKWERGLKYKAEEGGDAHMRGAAASSQVPHFYLTLF